jgi:hypothetical protein
MKPFIKALGAGVCLLGLIGCGAAYYGTALAIILTQESKDTIDTSFPDAKPTADAQPTFATLNLSSSMVTVERTNGPVTDFEVLSVDFPPGYGESISNRDADQNLMDGDRLVIRVNGDLSQELLFNPADVSTIGSMTAMAIQTKVRALTPQDPTVPAEAYTLFSASFDRVTGRYRFVSGAPGEVSAVLFDPMVRPGLGDAAPNSVSTTTSMRLGLGEMQGGIEFSGADSVGVTVLNRGTDVITEGTSIDLYLSHDKLLDTSVDLLFDRLPVGATIAVGEARRFSRRNGGLPPERLVRSDFTAGNYFLLYSVQSSGGETELDNNLLVSRHPIEIYQPVDDPATAVAEVANALDFSIVATSSPISVVTGNNFPVTVTVTNQGAPVPTGVPMAVDVILSADQTVQEPARFFDPAAVVAGVRINPTNTSRPITVNVVSTGTGPIATTVLNDVVTVTFDGGAGGASVASVQSLTDALNGAVGGLVRATNDGVGTPATDTLNALLAADGNTMVVAQDVLLSTRQVTFSATPSPLTRQTYNITDVVPVNGFLSSILPSKVVPLIRIRPQLPAMMGADPENTNNNVRQAANFVRIYERARAFFDANTGAILPTSVTSDFARLDAVSQRPVNAGSIRQGQQRVFSFDLPATGLAFDESQLLIILTTTGFDPHLDLLGPNGDFLAGSDDSPLGVAPIIYTSAQANAQSRTLYLVVSSARFDESDLSGGGESFELTISVNARQPTDSGLVAAVDAENLVENVEARLVDPIADPRTRNNVLVPFSLTNSRAEVMFVLPERARVRFATRPVFNVGVTSVITQFLAGSVPSPVENQPTLDEFFNRLIYLPLGGNPGASHILEAGVYTVAFDGENNQPDTQLLRIEIETEFIPED